jgi:hypothetical protein
MEVVRIWGIFVRGRRSKRCIISVSCPVLLRTAVTNRLEAVFLVVSNPYRNEL